MAPPARPKPTPEQKQLSKDTQELMGAMNQIVRDIEVISGVMVFTFNNPKLFHEGDRVLMTLIGEREERINSLQSQSIRLRAYIEQGQELSRNSGATGFYPTK